jgi:hypothetical protein
MPRRTPYIIDQIWEVQTLRSRDEHFPSEHDGGMKVRQLRDISLLSQCICAVCTSIQQILRETHQEESC